MGALVCPNAWQAKVMFHDANVSWSNILGIDVGVIPTLTQALTDEAEDVVHDSFDTHLKTLCPAEVEYDGIVLTDLRVEGGPQFTKLQTVVGTAGTDRLPDQLAVVVTLRTSLRTKAGRGRTYLGGFAEASNDAAGKIAAATVTACEAYMNDIKTGWAGATFTGDLGVISRKDPAFGFTGTIRPVVSLEVRDDQWDNQRRRRAGT
jgi:hypothetical protein